MPPLISFAFRRELLKLGEVLAGAPHAACLAAPPLRDSWRWAWQRCGQRLHGVQKGALLFGFV
jgi:hypothetical protein